MLRYLVANWIHLTAPERASWVADVPAREPSAYHWYVKSGMARWRVGKGPTRTAGVTDQAPTPVILNFICWPWGNYVNLFVVPATPQNVSGLIWHRGSGVGFAMTPKTAIAVETIPHIVAEPVADQVSIPGTYYYRVQYFNNTGLMADAATTYSLVLS
jgi:hypothetical protein